MTRTPWAGYVRVSHVGGRAGDRFHSPDEQTEAIRAWAKARHEPVDVLAPELDESGGRADRPVLLRAVEGVERGEYRGVVVAYLSRASRSVRHLLELWDRVEAAGGQVVAVAENIDTSTPAGRLTRTMLGAIAEHELDLHSERFETLRRTATERGVWQRRQTPRGYGRDPQTRRLVPDERAAEVREAFRARAAGEGIATIAARLGMTASGVRQLFANRVYLGELRVGDHVNPSAHPALVDAEAWGAAQRTVARPSRSKGAPALLAGLVRCAGCGHVMTRGGSSKHPNYGCPVRHSGGDCPEPATITLTVLDVFVERIALAELVRLRVTAAEGRSVEEAQAKVRTAERELVAYVESLTAADVGAEVFAAGARSRRRALDAAHARLDAEMALSRAMPAVGTGADAWATLDGHERNVLLRALLAAVVVRRAGGRGHIVPIESRVRVLAHGATVTLPERRGGEASGIVPIALPDLDEPGVLRSPPGENGLQRSGRRGQVRRGQVGGAALEPVVGVA